jgi:chromosome segregation ATPase
VLMTITLCSFAASGSLWGPSILYLQLTAVVMQESSRRESTLQATLNDQLRLSNAARDRAESDRHDLQRRLAAAATEMEALQHQKAKELDHVEARVKAAIQRKDENIATLRSQLDAALDQMRSTEAMLKAGGD